LLHEALPELLLLLTTFTDLANGWVDPFGETTEERHQVGDWARWGNLGDEFTGILAVSSGGFWSTVSKTSTDAAAETIGKSEVVLGINEKFVQKSLGFVADIAVVLLVEALGQDSVGELALVSPVI